MQSNWIVGNAPLASNVVTALYATFLPKEPASTRAMMRKRFDRWFAEGAMLTLSADWAGLALSICMTFSTTATAQTAAQRDQVGQDRQVRVQARVADKFVDSMGINVHMESRKTPYGNYALTNPSLHELGMRHFRDEVNDTSWSFVNELNAIGKLGYTLCGLIEGGNDYPPLGTRLESSAVFSMIHNLEPTIDAVEGPNEPDNANFVYDDVAYPQGAINESEDLWSIIKGNSNTNTLPVVVMSEASAPDFTQLAAITPPPIGYATYGNMHAYQGGGVGDNLLADWYIPYARDLTGSDAVWTTEMGYHNNTNYLKDGEQQGVSQRASAIYLPIAFLSGFDRGVLRTFSYELMDEVNDPHLTHPCSESDSGLRYCSGEGHYGLLNYDRKPKPAYTALRNLIALLREPGVRDFEPGSLLITFSGVPSTMRYTLLQKSSGAYYLALWNDLSVYKLAAKTKSGAILPGRDLYPQSVPVTVTFSEPRTLTIYAPNDASGVNPTDAYTIATSPQSIDLRLPPEVLLLEIR